MLVLTRKRGEAIVIDNHGARSPWEFGASWNRGAERSVGNAKRVARPNREAVSVGKPFTAGLGH